MKKSSIKMAVIVPALSVLLVGIIIMVAIVSILAANNSNNLTNRLIDARVNEYANEFEAIGDSGYSTVQTLAPVIENLMETSVDPRVRILQTLEKVLMSNEDVLAVWTCWEPNALDGKDAEFVNADVFYDNTGRFVPYVARDGAGVHMEPLADYDVSDYYTGARDSGKPYITDPYEYSVGGTTTNIYSLAVPILKDGKTVGVVGMDISLEKLNTAINAGSILDDGYLAVVSPGGLITTHRNSGLLLTSYKDNWIGNYKTEVEATLANGTPFTATAYSDVTNENMRLLASGVMVGDTGRYFALLGIVPATTVSRATNQLLATVISIGAALILIVGLVIFFVVSRATKKLPVITEMAERVAIGDVDIQGLDSGTDKTKNEVTLLERAFGAIIKGIRIQADVMAAIADGDYSVNVAARSEADVMNKAIGNMLDSTNSTLQQINSSTVQVATGAKQIADGAQALAQGSTEQAATVQQLSASIQEISQKTDANAEMASQSAKLAATIMQNAEKGSRQMGEMTTAVNEINQASQNIGKVIKAIDDIAFQTNILALNAAVEAARAGQHGKGFAVVADEVRSLAAKSAEAAKDTGELIASSIEKAQLGAQIAGETADSLNGIVSGIKESTKIAEDIARSSQEQSVGISQINDGIEQVAKVVQQNSATAEQSAAASEEMSSMAEMLETLIGQFKLKASNVRATPVSAPQPTQPARPAPPSTGMSLDNPNGSKY